MYTIFRDLGVHIDGFISMIAHSIVVGANVENKVTGKKANCFLAAHYASQAALRLMRPGNEVSSIIQFIFNIYQSSIIIINILYV